MIIKYWKLIGVGESKKGFWEIQSQDDDNILLHYVPDEDYSENDIKIKVPFEHFQDLLTYCQSINRTVNSAKNK